MNRILAYTGYLLVTPFIVLWLALTIEVDVRAYLERVSA